MRAVIYCRVSTERQVRQNDSLAMQRKACEDYCQRYNHEIVKTFIEEGESGTTLDRTQLQKLVAFCCANKGQVDVVVVYALNRFSRETLDHKSLRALLYSKGVTLRSVTEAIDDTPEGEFMEHIISGVAQFENRQRASRTIAGMKNKVEKGGWPFKATLGYLNITNEAEQRLVIHDSLRAPLLRESFERFATGLHHKEAIRKHVNRKGLRTKKGKPVSAQTFDRILRNPIYCGILRVKGDKVKDWDQERTANFEPIIDRETFNRVQALLAGRSVTIAPRQRNHQDFPLRHFVRCEPCNRAMTASWSKGRNGTRYGFYRCQNRLCKAPERNFRRGDMEGQFVTFLRRLQPNAGYLALYRAIVLEVWNQKKADAYEVVGTLEKKIADLRERKRKLLNKWAYDDGAMTKDEFMQMKGDLDTELLMAEQDHREARGIELDAEGVVNFAENVFMDAARIWQEMSSDQKQRFQQVLFPEGVTFSSNGYRTGRTCLMFSNLAAEEVQKTHLVALTGIEPVF